MTRVILRALFGAFLVAFLTVAANAPVRVMADPASAPAASAPAALSEDPAVTAAAKAFYGELLAGDVDRTKLSAQLDQALTPAMLTTISGQLTALGPARWQFVKQVRTPKGNVSLYNLVYGQMTLRMSFGMTDKGVIWDALLSPENQDKH